MVAHLPRARFGIRALGVSMVDVSVGTEANYNATFMIHRYVLYAGEDFASV
jgi:hypothetical protein